MVFSLGELIKKRRKELKITQPHLAELAGVSINTLYKIERGETNPTLEIINKIVSVLGLELTLKPKDI